MEHRKKTALILGLTVAAVLLVALVILAVLAIGQLAGRPGQFRFPGRETTQEPTPVPTQAWTTPSDPGPTVPPNPYGPEDFLLEDDYMTCLAGDYMAGIDVSFWQGDVDYQKVREAGFEFVMIRLGWRGSKDGLLSEDEMVRKNLERASKAGMKIGGYFFSQAITPEEAREEARFALEIAKDYDLQLPIVYDWEYLNEEARTAHVDKETLTDCTKAFCQVIEDAGYEPMIYFNPVQSHKKMDLVELMDYKFWLAMYDSPMDYPYRVDMWQYSCTGTVPGISGAVDLNLYLLYPE